MIYTNRQLAQAIIETSENNSVSKVSNSIIQLLSEHGELYRMQDIISEIENAWRDRYGIGTISIESTEKISDELRKKIYSIAKGAEIHEKINKDLIGGVKLKIDDKVIDGSIQGHLKQLKRTLQES